MQVQLEHEFPVRFPVLFGKILGELKYESLALFREVSRNLNDNIDKERVYWTRKIQKYLVIKSSPFENEWKLSEIAGNWLEMAINGWKWVKITGHGCKWLETRRGRPC